MIQIPTAVAAKYSVFDESKIFEFLGPLIFSAIFIIGYFQWFILIGESKLLIKTRHVLLSFSLLVSMVPLVITILHALKLF